MHIYVPRFDENGSDGDDGGGGGGERRENSLLETTEISRGDCTRRAMARVGPRATFNEAGPPCR